jgi:hypothetical protein
MISRFFFCKRVLFSFPLEGINWTIHDFEASSEAKPTIHTNFVQKLNKKMDEKGL